MEIKKLRELQEIFIEAKDWTEVSKLQFEIDLQIDQEKTKVKTPKLESWFKSLMYEMALNELKSEANEIIYLLEKIQNSKEGE